MTSVKSRLQRILEAVEAKPYLIGLPAGFIAVFLLITRIFTVRPAIMQDEYIYARFARQLPMADAPIPDYLFYWVFGSTNSCGPAFYSCAKSINILFFIGIAILLYLISVRYVSKSIAWFVGVAFLFSPIGTYASFFMPEMMFFFFTILFVYFLLRQSWASSYKTWFLLGLLLGMASLTKPHALFLAIPITVYIFYLGKNSELKFFRDSVKKILTVGIASVISKFLFGFLFAGVNGLSLFGTSYSGTISATAKGITNPDTLTSEGAKPAPTLLDLLNVFFGQIWGHSSAIALLLFVPLAIGMSYLGKRSKVDFELKKLSVLILAVVATGILSISAFTALITFNGAEHSSRVMIRYYDYVVPLALILVALAVSKSNKLAESPSARTSIGILSVFFVALLGAATGFAPFETSFLDGTSFNAISSGSVFIWVAFFSFFVFVAVWLSRRNKLVPYLAGLVVLTLTVGLNGAATESLRPSSGVDEYDAAASFVKNYLSEEELAALTVIAFEDYPLARSLFEIDNPNVDYRVVERGSTFGSKFLNEDKEWVLLIGDTFIDGAACLRVPGAGFVLQKMCTTRQFFFNQDVPNSQISSLQGFGKPEHWGAWTLGNNSEITFSNPLPANAKIKITMSIPNYNSDQTLSATVGDSKIEFELTQDVIDGEFEFQNTYPTNKLYINVPAPKSERSEDVSVNERPVGIRMYAIEIEN